jgi:hypothetical protein
VLNNKLNWSWHVISLLIVHWFKDGVCLLDSISLIIFHLLHIRPFFTHTSASIVKLKEHQRFVLCISWVPDKVAINEKGKK